MSQASKHVDWCLNKATKEVEECQKLGKRPKHRGLLKSDPDNEEARKHLAKAEHNLKAITHFKDTGFSDWSIQHFVHCCSKNGLKKLHLIFHSFELLLIAWALTLLYAWFSIVWLAFLAGFSLHLLLDHWKNGTPALFYFFFYRWKHQFQNRLLFTKERCC